MKHLLLITLLFGVWQLAWADQETPDLAAQLKHVSFNEQVQSVLKKYRVPGATMTVVNRHGVIWQEAYGASNLNTNQPAQGTTRFRAGSIAKMFIAMSVMKLNEQGKLSLDDKLSSLAPEVVFVNQWEQTHPITVADLLAHTTGWDGTHFAENAHNQSDPATLSTAISFHPHSRESRWPPGTRTAYNNGAPVIAAYLVEKYSGLRFEQFVEKHFLSPLGMHDTGYFNSKAYQQNASQQYVQRQAVPYRHLLNRAAGGLNTSTNDLAKFAQFLLNSSIGKSPLLTEESMKHMQFPTHTSAFESGLEVNWGLGLQSFSHNGFVFYGHQGALRGANAMLVYQPELGLAHVVMMNTNSPALGQLHTLLAQYISKGQEVRSNAVDEIDPLQGRALHGYYRVLNPISSLASFGNLLMPFKISYIDQKLNIKPVLGGQLRALATDQQGNIVQPDSGKTVLVKSNDLLAGEVWHYGPTTLQKISLVQAIGPILLVVIWLLMSLVIFVFSFFWGIGLLRKRLTAGPEIWVRIGPLATVICLITLLLVLQSIFRHPFAESLLGNLTVHSVFITLLTGLFGLLSLINFIPLIRYRKVAMNTVMLWFHRLFSLVNLMVAVILLTHDFIGIRTWAY